MKNNKKTAAQPLSKKQRKKLQKNGAAAPESKKMSREKKWLISLIAGVCVLSIACASFGGILLARALDGVFDDPTKAIYETIDLSHHLDTKGIDDDFYTGAILNLTEVTKAEEFAPYDLAYMDKYFENQRVINRVPVKELQRQTVIGIADTVALYVTDFFVGDPKPEEEKENRLEIPDHMLDLFGTYTSYTTFIVGMGIFGEDFDKKIVELAVKPEDTWRTIRQNGKISVDDTVCMSLFFYKSKGKSATPYADELADRYTFETTPSSKYTQVAERVDLDADLDERLYTALAENCKALGEEFSFVLEDYNLTGGTSDADKSADYKVVATAHYVIEEEKTVDITFEVPEGYFTEDDDDFYGLNGKTATMRAVILYSDDCKLPEANRAFVTDVLKMQVEAKDDAGAVAEYKAKMLEKLNAEQERKKQEAMVSAAITHFVNLANKTESFFESNREASSIANAIQAQLSRTVFEEFVSARREVPTSETLEEYVTTIARANQLNVSSADEYISYLYSAYGEQMKKSDLLAYHIFDEEGMKISDEEIDAAVEEYLDRLVSSMWDSETYDREYFVDLLGEDLLKARARRDLVYKMVGEYLIENNLTKVE